MRTAMILALAVALSGCFGPFAKEAKRDCTGFEDGFRDGVWFSKERQQAMCEANQKKE